MSATAKQVKRLRVDRAKKLVRAFLKRRAEAEAVVKLGDDELLQAINGAIGAMSAKKAILAASAMSAAFERIASVVKGRRPQILVDAKSSALRARIELVGRRELLPPSNLRDLLGITRQALNKALHANRIFALEVSGENFYPAFYGDARLDRRKVERVTKALGDLSGWSKWQFFTTPKGSLGGLTPLEALRKGRVSETLRAADGFAER